MIRTDEELKKTVVDHLFWDDSIDAAGIKVEVLDGRAILSGTVPTFALKEEASNAAWLVPGIKNVENLLTVRFPPDVPAIADTQIENNAKNMLSWNSNIHGQSISIKVNDGVVTLEGTTATYWQRDKAERVVSDLLGVVDVQNNIIVVPTEQLTDEVIAKNIKTALKNRPPLEAEDIEVHIDHGEVTLKGFVPTWRDRIDAYSTVILARGVTNVHNKIEVQY